MSIEEMLKAHPFEDACGSLKGVSKEVQNIAFHSYKIGLYLGFSMGLDTKVQFINKNNLH